MSTEEIGLVQAYVLDGDGGGKSLNDWSAVRQWRREQGILWLHLDFSIQDSINWLQNESGLEPITVQSLIINETRPRSVVKENSLTVFLRGVNLNAGQDPEDMVSIRIWLDANRIITTRKRKILSIVDVRKTIDAGNGPKSTIEFFTALNDRLAVRMHEVVDSLSERVDELEDNFLTNDPDDHRLEIMKIRQMSVMLRRYLNPQQEAIHHLQIGHSSLLNVPVQEKLRETGDRLKRYTEELDATRERAAILHEEIMSRTVDLTNRRMYLLAVVSLIFLPLSFLNGLLGINVAGIPGAENHLAFLVVCVICILIGFINYKVLKKSSWI